MPLWAQLGSFWNDSGSIFGGFWHYGWRVKKIDNLIVDNLDLNGNTLSTTNTDGDLVLSPNGNGDIDASTSVIKNVTTPSASHHAATKGYVDGLVQGIHVKTSVKYATQEGASKYIFSFKNNTGNSLVIKKISLTCNEMYSTTIKWSASFSTNAEFITNQSETLPAMSTSIDMPQQNKIGVQYGDLGIGFSEWNDDTYNQNNQSELPADYFLLISINDMTSIHSSYSNKKFTATVYYA